MKKLTGIFFAAILCLGLTACGGAENGDESSSGNSAAGDSNVVEESSVVEDSSAPAEESSAAPEESSPEENAGGEQGSSVEISALRDAVAEALGENYFPNAEMPPEFLEGYGLTADLYDEFFGEMPMISANVDQIVIVRAKEGQVEAVEQALNSYRDYLVNDSFQYPQNLGKVQASQLAVIGQYVCFVQLGGAVSDLLDAGDEEVIRHCQEQNQLAINALEAALQ